METIYVHATLIDGSGRDPVDNAWVKVSDGVIHDVGTGPVASADASVVDCSGRTIMPGLIDCHAHVGVVDGLDTLEEGSRAVYAARVLAEVTATLEDGFTTVRDAGYTDWGFKEAIRQGLVRGPRLFVSNGPISQTGGHSDRRRRHQHAPPPFFDGSAWSGVVVDGVDQARWGAREVLRAGADQVKVMASGGCASEGDEVTEAQFTVEELTAITSEARARNKPVIAHAYNPESITNAVRAGVRSIEHGNLLDEEAAALMARSGVYLVPTIATFQLLAVDGADVGLDAEQVSQVEHVLEHAYESVEIARSAGVQIGSGSDVLGKHQRFKALELELQAKVMGTMGAIKAATSVNAEMMGLGDRVGRIAPGLVADLLVVDGDVGADISLLQQRDRIVAVVQQGSHVVDRLETD